MGESPNSTKLNVALTWLRAGVGVLPIVPGTKRAAVAWRVYQSRLPAEADVRAWFALGSRYELAVICGGRAGLVVLDFDERDSFAAWRAGCDVQTFTVATPRGYHVYLYVAGVVRSFDVPGVEVRGPGRYVLTPPSLHPSGAAYRVFDGSPVARVESLADVLPAEPRDVRLPQNIQGITPAGRGAGRIEALKSSLVLFDVVCAAGVELRSSDGGRGRWFVGCCVFHDDVHPSLWVDVERGRWGCFAAHCRAHGSHDAIDFVSMARGVPVRELLAGGGA